ncbi:Titin [Holothuria leucospilota]|uniref:Titin n=1 Tax=Holothuria leucospilota TaxID=206669 RepID=A0A9Q1BV49_HOLLE|nr:Titin [Holothuria leucospilota]
MNRFNAKGRQRCSAVQRVFVKSIILFGLATAAFACRAADENDYDVETHIWTEWYSNDDPVSDGEDYERKIDIYPRDSRCTGEPTDVQCRAKYSKINYDATGDVGVTCSTSDGLRCQNSAQGGGTCLDYEIRFQCQDAMPFAIPEYHFDFSGKANANDMDPVKCDSTGDTVFDRTNRLSGTLNDNRLFYLQDGPPNTDHSCTLWTGSTSVIDFLPLLDGICISEPLCCEEGFTLDFWAYTPALQGGYTSIFGTGGHADGRVGVAVQIRPFNSTSPTYLEFALRYTEAGGLPYHVILYMPEASLIGQWFHFTGVYDNSTRTACLYIDGQDSTTSGCKMDYLLNVAAVTTTNYDNMRLFDRVYANPVLSKRSPDAKLSDMKIYFSYMNAAEVAELHRRQTTGAHVHVYYIGLVSDPRYEDVVLECKAHGSEGDTIEFRWLTSSDGVEFIEIDPASASDVFVYNEDLMNNYQYVSRFHFINHISQTTKYACEGYDPATRRTSSQSFDLTFTSVETTWTPWMSSDSPDDDTNDIESLANIKMAYPQVCSEPLDVECRTLYNRDDFSSTGQTFLHSCTTTDGLHCVGSSQTGGRCFDYEVRFLCPGVNYRWTEWCDADDGGTSDDDETFTNHKSQGYASLCEFPLFAECRTVADVQWYDIANIQLQYPYICTKEGLYCNKDDNSGSCPDFKVRYACPYYPGTYPDYKWELGGRSLLTDEFPTDCGSLSEDTFLSTVPAASANGLSSVLASFISAPSSVEAHCSPILDGSMNLNLGNFISSCITDASLCADGATFTFWFQRRAVSGADIAYFISTGSQIETSKGLAFYQEPTDGNLTIRVKTRFKAWDAIVDKSEFPLNNWKHVIISITPFVGISYFIDGVLKGTVTEYSSSTFNIEYPSAKTTFILGAENENFAENGNAAFSDIRVYETALQESHVATFALCGEADGQVNVTLASTSHPLNPTRTLECRAWGFPAPTIEWLWLEDVGQPGLASTVSVGASTSESNSAVGCWKTSILTIPDYASSVYADKDIVCKATNDVEFDLQWIHVDPVEPCELSLGVSSGALLAIQFEDSLSGTLSEVPGLDGTFSWDDQSSSNLIIDLVVDHTIVGIALQLHQDPPGSAYAPSVDIDYEDDSETWQVYEAFTLETIDSSAASTQWFSFSSPQNTSKLRINPSTWSSDTQLRIDLYGCQVDDLPHELNLTGGYDYMTNTFTAVCTSSTYPAPTLTWQYSGGTPDPGRYSDDTNVGITLSTSTLEISPFEVGDDNITITCTSTSTQGVMVDSLVPGYGFTGSVVLTGPSSVAIGAPFTLTCDVSGDDMYNLDWYFQLDGVGIASLVIEDVPSGITLSDTSLLVPAGGTASLSFTTMESSYSGTYICSVNNGTNSDSIDASVYVIPGNVTIIGNTSAYDRTTNTFTLSCEFDYDGDYLNASWSVPNLVDEIFGNWSNSKLDIVSLGSSSSLTILSFNFSSDDGDYTCRGGTSGGGEVDYNFTIHYAFSGTISLNSSTTNIFYGDTVVVTASVQGDTVYHVAWYYAETNNSIETLITPSGNILLSDTNSLIGGGGIATLTIMDFTTGDDGVYTIVINNGSAEGGISLFGREPVGNITITGNSSNYQTDSNTYLLTCEFVYDGVWLNVSWIVPSSPDEIFSNYTDGKYEVISECCSSPATSSLLIYSFNYTIDDGIYQCQGYTSGGGSMVSFNHSIDYEFTGTVTLAVNDVVQYGQGTLVCQIEGDTIYNVEWQFIAEGSSIALPIVNSGTVWTSNSTQGIGTTSATSDFRIDSWPSENDGTYFCEVNQGSGQDSALVIGATLESISIMTSCNSSTDVCIVTCVVSYTSITPNITWNAPPIVSEISPGDVVGRISVSEESNPGEISSTLTITAADPTTDNINYTCRASLFDVYSLQNTTELFVPIANEASIVQLDGEYNGTLQQYWLQCTVTFTGIPPNISWITPAGDNVTETSTKFTVTEELNGNNITSVLLVNSSNFQQDDGIYTCQASQNNILKQSEDIGIFQAYSGPLTVSLTTSITLGDAVILECVAGDPDTAFDIQWYYTPDASPSTAQLITNSPLHDVTAWTNASYGLVSHLQVNLFSLKENGVYTCSVNGGSMEQNLTVEGTKGKRVETGTFYLFYFIIFLVCCFYKFWLLHDTIYLIATGILCCEVSKHSLPKMWCQSHFPSAFSPFLLSRRNFHFLRLQVFVSIVQLSCLYYLISQSCLTMLSFAKCCCGFFSRTSKPLAEKQFSLFRWDVRKISPSCG